MSNFLLLFFVQSKKSNQKKTALLMKNSFINFVLKTKIHKLTSFKHMNFYVLFTALITNYFSMQGFLFYMIFVHSHLIFSMKTVKNLFDFFHLLKIFSVSFKFFKIFKKYFFQHKLLFLK